MDNTNIAIGISAVALIVAGTSYFLMGSTCASKPSSNKIGLEEKQTTKKSGNEKSAEKYPAGPMSIYFGSQTGTAEGFARTLMEEGKSRGFAATMVDLEDFTPETLVSSRLAVFLVATYGEGEPTDNAAKFQKWLKNADKDVEDGFLQPLKFSVFGLGNRQYEHFNRQGKFTNDGLEKLGATRVFEYGEGDDDGSLEEDFENWRTKMWPCLIRQFHRGSQQALFSEAEEASKVSLTFNTVFVDGSAVKRESASLSQVSSSTKHFFSAPAALVTANRELREANAGSTRHIEISLEGLQGVTYETADNLAVLPENSPELVASLCKHMGFPLDRPFVTKAAPDCSGFKPSFPTPCTAREALMQFFDIQGLLRASTAALLVPYVQDAKQKSWLMSLLEKENRDKFHQYVDMPRRSIASLLQNELSSCKIPLDDFLHILPFMQPRYYTISSSSSRHPQSIHITVSVTEYEAEGGRIFRGVASSYLQCLEPNASRCRVFVRPSSFRLPTSPSTPIVMIGPGTGVAPMRALLQEREEQNLRAEQRTGSMGRNTLYFGCQSANKDFIYRNELEGFEKSGTLSELFLAFSRDQSKKVYVQHLLQQSSNASALVENLDKGAYIYVCGATAMGTDVLDAILKILQSKKNLTKQGAEEYVKDLQENGRYVQELWSA